MMRRVSLVVFALAGCEMWNAPDKVQKLESRVDELTAEVSAMSGKPVGVGKTKTADKHDDKHDAKPADEHAKPVEKADHDAKPEEHADKSDKPAGPPKDVDATEGKIELDFHPEKKGSVAELAKKVGKELDKPEEKHEKPHWAYEGPLGFEAWGSLDKEWNACSKGKQQSPIDIAPHAAGASAIEFHYKPTAAAIVDNGHTGQVNVAPGSSIEIDNHTYELVQFHTHTPSEHTIAGERFPLEVHLVHKDADGKLAVIGVMYEEGADTKALEPLYTKWPEKKQAESKLRKAIDPTSLLPANHSVYRYSGSLTTPPCSEGVVWNVMRRSMSDTKPHLAAIAGHYKNARSVQTLGDRKVQ